MKLDPSLVKAYVDSMRKWMDVLGGTGCESVRFGDGSGMGVDYLMEVKDEAVAVGLLKTIQADWDAAGLAKLYEDMGMPMSFEFLENVREHKGVTIHRVKMNMLMEQMAEEQRRQFEAMGLGKMKYEVAVLDGVMVVAMGESQIGDLIDRLKDSAFVAAPLKARSVYPAGAAYYVDIDVGQYMAFVAAFVPETPGNPMQQIVPLLKGAEPITAAGYRSDGRVKWSVNVPGDLMAKIGQVAMTMQMQKMQQQGGAPQSAPPQ